MIVDSHCHLNDSKFKDADISALIQNAKDAGVELMQTICCKKADFPEIHSIAMNYPEIYCSFGIHPHHAGEEPLTYAEIIEAGKQAKVIGIGETGLDYYYNNAPKDVQIESFKMHIRAAKELDLPVIIHTRDAEEDTMHILDEMFAELGDFKALLHCFSSSYELAEYAIRKGIYLSASGIISFKNTDHIAQGFKDCPLDKILIETDAPYLAPVPHRGKRNEPAFTKNVADKLAEIRGITTDEVAKATTDNFFKLFSKVEKG